MSPGSSWDFSNFQVSVGRSVPTSLYRLDCKCSRFCLFRSSLDRRPLHSRAEVDMRMLVEKVVGEVVADGMSAAVSELDHQLSVASVRDGSVGVSRLSFPHFPQNTVKLHRGDLVAPISQIGSSMLNGAIFEYEDFWV